MVAVRAKLRARLPYYQEVGFIMPDLAICEDPAWTGWVVLDLLSKQARVEPVMPANSILPVAPGATDSTASSGNMDSTGVTGSTAATGETDPDPWVKLDRVSPVAPVPPVNPALAVVPVEPEALVNTASSVQFLKPVELAASSAGSRASRIFSFCLIFSLSSALSSSSPRIVNRSPSGGWTCR